MVGNFLYDDARRCRVGGGGDAWREELGILREGLRRENKGTISMNCCDIYLLTSGSILVVPFTNEFNIKVNLSLHSGAR